MKFERHHEILKRLSKFGSVKVDLPLYFQTPVIT